MTGHVLFGLGVVCQLVAVGSMKNRLLIGKTERDPEILSAGNPRTALGGADWRHLRRTGGVDGLGFAEEVAAGNPPGGITDRVKEAEFGAIIVVGAGEEIDVRLLQLLQCGHDLLRPVDKLEELARSNGFAQSLQIAVIRDQRRP